MIVFTTLMAALAIQSTLAMEPSSRTAREDPFQRHPHLDVEKASRRPPPVLNELPPIPKGADGDPITNLTVFLIPHSHDDTGWQRNVDQYYEEQVRYIYDSVVQCLLANRERRFIFVEVAYFMRWWRDQDEDTQKACKGLIDNGQIEFVNGGWCMADNASPSMDGQIDQLTFGHRYIQDVLGVIPKYAWAIDPFGISASYSLWWKQMNYTAWIFNRIDTRLKDLWHNNTHLQFQWNPQDGGDEGIFGHVLDTHYGSPVVNYKGTSYHFDWEFFGGLGGGSDPDAIPVVEKAPSTFYNATVESEAEAFVALVRLRAAWYKLGAPHQKLPAGQGAILVPFGDDMKFQNAWKQYSNMDRLIKQVNKDPSLGVTLRYGTIDDYFQYINTASADWPTFEGDFMPLGTDNNIYSTQMGPPGPTGYWTGHYTTRPLMKGLVAQANGAKHTSEIAASISCALNPKNPATDALCSDEPNADLMKAREVTGVLQHHDNIPGTSNVDAAINLDVRLRASLVSSQVVMETAMKGLMGNTNTPSTESSKNTHTTKGSKRVYSVGETVTVWNSLAQSRSEYFELTVAADGVAADGLDSEQSLIVTDESGVTIPSQLIPAVPVIPNLNNTKDFSRNTVLVFLVTIPPLSSMTYTLSAGGKANENQGEWVCSVPG